MWVSSLDEDASVVLLLFLLSWLVRLDNSDHGISAGSFTVQVIAIAVGGAAAWLGGELVERLGIGVHEEAGPDAPSSLTRPGQGTRR